MTENPVHPSTDAPATSTTPSSTPPPTEPVELPLDGLKPDEDVPPRPEEDVADGRG